MFAGPTTMKITSVQAKTANTCETACDTSDVRSPGNTHVHI